MKLCVNGTKVSDLLKYPENILMQSEPFCLMNVSRKIIFSRIIFTLNPSSPTYNVQNSNINFSLDKFRICE